MKKKIKERMLEEYGCGCIKTKVKRLEAIAKSKLG